MEFICPELTEFKFIPEGERPWMEMGPSLVYLH